MLVKICGISKASNLKSLVERGKSFETTRMPDWYGLIFIERSSRCIKEEDLIELVTYASSNALKLVGVFENASTDYVCEIVSRNNLYAVQLHGDEDREFISRLKTQYQGPIIKAYNVGNLPKDIPYDLIDFILIDAPQTIVNGEEIRGGTGHSYDWKILHKLDLRGRIIMSGGLGLHNIDELLRFHDSFEFAGIDFNSKVEESVGIKDAKKIEEVLSRIACHESSHQRL